MKKIESLKSGDTIGICAPSASFDTDRFNRGVQVLKNLGFAVKVPDQIFQTKRYLAGDDVMRADTLMQLFSDPEVAAIICARGGYGAMRILDYIDWTVIRQNSKPFIGFSDATALLIAIMDRCDMPVIHGPCLTSLPLASAETIDSLYDLLTGKSASQLQLKNDLIHPGTAVGVLKGGNLSTLSHMIGTPFQPDFDQCILFIEDINEPAYKIDRMLTQMKMAGLLDRVAGVVAGSFAGCKNESYIPQILSEVFYEYKIPVLTGIDAGHGEINLSFFMGETIEINSQDLVLKRDIS